MTAAPSYSRDGERLDAPRLAPIADALLDHLLDNGPIKGSTRLDEYQPAGIRAAELVFPDQTIVTRSIPGDPDSARAFSRYWSVVCVINQLEELGLVLVHRNDDGSFRKIEVAS